MSKSLKKNIIFVVMVANHHSLNNYTEDCYYASNIPCKLESGVISQLLVNNPVSGDFFQMTKKTFQLIKHSNQSIDVEIDFDDTLIRILTNEYNYEKALVLASMYPNNKKEIILPKLFEKIYFNYKNIIVKCESIDLKLVNDIKKEDLNNLIDKCYFKTCQHKYYSDSDCENCVNVESQFTLLSQYLISGTWYQHHCENAGCLNVLKNKRKTKIINDVIENFEINLIIDEYNRIELNDISRRLFRQRISSKLGISPKSWFVDLKINELMNSMELGNSKKTFINELFAERMSVMPAWFSNDSLCEYNLKPNLTINDYNSLNINKLHYFYVSNDHDEYINGKIGKIFQLCHINELFIAAKVFLGEINNALNKSLVMSDIIIYGGSILSVMSGTNVNDYNMRLKQKLTDKEMLSLIKVLFVKYSDSFMRPLYVDKIKFPSKLIITIKDRRYDFNNSDSDFNNLLTISGENSTHIYLEFNEKVVKTIICNEYTLKLMENGTISCSNYFCSDDKIIKYLRKGFTIEGLEDDLELEHKVTHIIKKYFKEKQNKLISVRFSGGQLKKYIKYND
jgi:hypothetical protein